MIATHVRFAGLVCLLAISLSNDVRAALVAYDDFNYSPIGSDLNGNGGGGSFGFANSWTGNTSYNIGAGNLASPLAPQPQLGNSVTAVAYGENRGIDRILTTPLGVEGTSAYISVLIQPQGIFHQGAFNGWFALVLRGSTDVVFGMSSFGDEIGLEVGFERSATNVKAAIGQTFFGVIRIDFTEGVDPTYLYLNPQPGAPEPATPSASLINLNVNFLNMVSLTGPGGVGYDSLRIGATYADVTPVPEPASAILLAGVTACIAARRGRKTA
ncbi:MAG: hypothetical protein C0485_17845 [Pirellula sp.]|nr:hypothetical protein [Pirellula sp.]